MLYAGCFAREYYRGERSVIADTGKHGSGYIGGVCGWYC